MSQFIYPEPDIHIQYNTIASRNHLTFEQIENPAIFYFEF